ncbi:hypothetical protein [Actinomadura verrucosospora]|uniref:Uncharacterized protein n=1 Tax=Actinomadura verrucosospora TaxID=46165 RepID=A0A7D3ZTA3_ACTVE|nr:hypothetical protein [Actinomadura verrucosospora]QKG27263.1 hypothetical protein ACTIVE_8916 [Actinomadura verrucosospora]
MSSPEAVIVPVRVTALMVNDAVRNQDWRRWRPDFTRRSHLSPEPDPLNQPVSRPDTGVLVHWELPTALRNGALQPDGTTSYAAVPTRWLVVRYGGGTGTDERSAAGWLVHSDCLSDTEAADNSPYAIPTSGTDPTPVPKRIGRVRPLEGDLSEPADVPPSPLTAIGPGLPTFATYQPYNMGVFSMHDPLTGLTGDPLDLSYLVMGWYGTDADDPLADITANPPARFQEKITERLKRLGWDCPVPAAPVRTVCSGAAIGVRWEKTNAPARDRDEAPVTEDDPQKRPVTYGVAESSVDGISALALAHNTGFWKDPERLRRLQALQYGLLHQLDTRDGMAAVQQRTREARFEPVAGGFTWDFTSPRSAQGKESQPIRPLPEPERTWLADTNEAQRAYDAAVRQLARRQERLYELWWYAERLNVIIASTRAKVVKDRLKKLKQGVDTNLKALTGKVKAGRTALAQAPALLKAVTPEDLGTAIDAETKRLTELWKRAPVGRPTRTPRPVFHNAREPVVLIKGAKATRLLDDPAVIPCRLSGQTVTTTGKDAASTAVRPQGWAALKKKIPAKIPTGLPENLLTELAALDRSRTPATVTFADQATAVAWSAPDRRALAVRRATSLWKQPWTPLLLVWEAEYFAVPYHHYQDAGKSDPRRNWEFGDDFYQWRGEGDAAENKAVPRSVSGSILLSAHAVDNIAERLRHVDTEAPGQSKEFLDAVGDLAGHLADGGGGTDLISQALDGFTEQLTGRESRVRPRPKASVADILDGHHTFAPRALSAVTGEPADPTLDENWVAAPHYAPYRAGQFRFSRLFLVDRFGRGHEIVHTADRPDQRPAPARAATVVPDAKDPRKPGDADALVHIGQQGSWARHLFQLRPRLPQPARIGFEFISRMDDAQVAFSADTGDQISAWIVPNYFDGALLCMAADGLLLGELRSAQSTLVFERYHPDAPTLGQNSAEHPHLGRFLNGLNSRDDRVVSLADLIATVETARLAIVPDRPSSSHPTLRMLGHPLALMRARLELEGDAEPIVPILPSRLAADPPVAEYQNYAWPILLGSNSSFEDGLIGYFDQDDYTELRAVAPPHNPSGGYVAGRDRGTGLALRLGESRLVTLLADPWAGVQADTHVLPTAFLRPDVDYIAHALAHMDAVFHVGPALGRLQGVTVERGDGTETVTQAFGLPLPLVESGDWTWKRPDGTTIAVTATDTTARITPEFRAHLRTGLLHLANGMTRRHDPTTRP